MSQDTEDEIEVFLGWSSSAGNSGILVHQQAYWSVFKYGGNNGTLE